MKKVILAFSGGLDTSFCVLYLQEKGHEVITLTVDTGGFSPGEKREIASRAKLLKTRHVFVNAQKELYANLVSYIIKGNILRGGVYPLCAGTERIVIAAKLVELAKKEKAVAVAHGSTGAGNDQIRFDLTVKVLDPNLQMITPIRDLGITRNEEIKYLEEHGIPVSNVSKSYSVNKGLLGITIGGKETKGSWESPPEEVYPEITPLAKTPDQPEELVLSFKNGLPVAVNNQKMSGLTIMEKLAKVGGKHGVGKNIHLGNTILGIKGRVAFAAPAITILIKAHKELEKLVQTKWQAFWKDTLSDTYGNFLHEGLYFDPVMRDVEAMIDSSQSYVTGDVKVKLFKGNIIIAGCRSPYSLMSSKIAVYGEESSGWTGSEAAGFSKLYGLQTSIAMSVQKRKKI